jgi:hypothetical protein
MWDEIKKKDTKRITEFIFVSFEYKVLKQTGLELFSPFYFIEIFQKKFSLLPYS